MFLHAPILAGVSLPEQSGEVLLQPAPSLFLTTYFVYQAELFIAACCLVVGVFSCGETGVWHAPCTILGPTRDNLYEMKKDGFS